MKVFKGSGGWLSTCLYCKKYFKQKILLPTPGVSDAHIHTRVYTRTHTHIHTQHADANDTAGMNAALEEEATWIYKFAFDDKAETVREVKREAGRKGGRD